MNVEAFNSWGWRIPFLLSVFLVAISIYIRMKMEESPMFTKIKAAGKLSVNPIKESFGKKENLRMVLIALFGITAGQGVVWYTGQFYALSFIQKTCNVEFVQSNYIIAVALLIGTPLFIVFGAWSDRVGRKLIMMAGLILAVLLYRPIYKGMYSLTDMSSSAPLTEERTAESDVITVVKQYADGTVLTERVAADDNAPISRQILLGTVPFWDMIALVAVQVILVTMVYGPIAAFLVELFPTRIRYTSMSLPYHIGNGIFGGLTPFIATSLYELSKTESAPAGDPFAGLWYPIGVAAVCFIIGMLFLSNKPRGEVLDDLN